MDIDMGNHLLTQADEDEGDVDDESQEKYRQAMKDRLGNDGNEAKILSFKQKAPKAQEGESDGIMLMMIKVEREGSIMGLDLKH